MRARSPAGLVFVWWIAHGLAQAAPVASPRVRMAARGQLDPGSLGDGLDARALITVRASGGAAALAALGFDARPLLGELALVRAGRAELAQLIALDGVLALEERRLLFPALDRSGPATGAPAARAQTGIDGSGVLIGVVDTGIDFRHADLRHADGSTRIAALLDLAHARDARHPEIRDYAGGDLWLADEIDGALLAEAAGMTPALPVLERDTDGHGTHVAAIAAANGLATGRGLPAGRYVGMAPGADLVVVQATRGGPSFTDADVITSCQFILDRAAALGRPVVINLSLGGLGGAHDGSSNFERALDGLFPADAPGRALVVAAGNEGTRDLHAGAWRPDGDLDLPLAIGASSSTDARASIEIYYRGKLSIAVDSPSGTRFGPVAPGETLSSDNREGHLAIDDASGGARGDGLSSAGVVVSGPPGGAPAAGTWHLHLLGAAARADAWVIDSPPGAPFAHFLDHVAVDDRLALPATARNVIGVGSFVTKNRWTDRDGQPVTRPTVLDDVSSFSSSGPTADGRFAPDLVAPGDFIAAALSADAPPDQPSSAFFAGAGQPLITWADDGLHGLLRGTSQAAPHVTGAAALLLAVDPTLTAGAVREILRATAKDDGAGFSPRSGFGRLDVASALSWATGHRGGAVSATTSSVGVSRDALPPGDETVTVTVTPRDDFAFPLGPGHAVAIALSAGVAIGEVVDAGWGRYQRTFAAHALRGAVATVSASVDGMALDAHPRVFFVLDRSEIGQPFVATGGCTPIAARPRALLLAVPLLLFFLFGVHRRRGGET